MLLKADVKVEIGIRKFLRFLVNSSPKWSGFKIFKVSSTVYLGLNLTIKLLLKN